MGDEQQTTTRAETAARVDTSEAAFTAQRVTVIANPVSGTNPNAVTELRAALGAREDLVWDLFTTEKSGDARELAREAARQHVDAVAVWGGDGTVMEVADGLRETGTPMLVLPGGTASVMSVELAMPRTMQDGLALLWNGSARLRPVDMGCIDSEYFLLRVGIGFEAAATAWTAREEKRRWGRLAYIRRALRLLRGLQTVRYRITLDDQTVVAYGITCLICNSTNIGAPSMNLSGKTDISDGLLDVIILRDMTVITMTRIMASVLQGLLPHRKESAPPLDYWQARRVTVAANRRQAVARDGEPMKRAKQVTAYAVPHAVQMIVPV